MKYTRSRLYAAAAALLIAFVAPALAQFASESQVNLPGGGFRHSESFKSNYYIYRSIGGETYLKEDRKVRKWYCLWLCKVRVDKKADSITIENTYYAEVRPGVFASLSQAATCKNAASCKQKIWAAGLVLNINFPGENGGLLPIDGVVTHHIIVVGGQTFEEWTAIGKHPENPPVIL